MAGDENARPDPLEDECFLERVRAVHRRHRSGPPGSDEAPPGYHILEELHRGGQGIVYAAVQEATKRTVALKVMLSRPLAERERIRFEREVELAASLSHPNIVTPYDSGWMPGGAGFLSMERIDGVTLDVWRSELRERAGGASTDELVRLFLDIALAIEHAHQHGVIHRDLKPANVMVDSGDVPHVLDFGVAKPLGPLGEEARQGITRTGEFVGSLAWSAPEQVGTKGGVGTRTDVHALGLLLYHLLTGEHPYPLTGSLTEIVRAISTAEPVPPSRRAEGGRVPRDLDAILLKALRKDPEQRYGSAGELALDCRRFLEGRPVRARPPTRAYLAQRLVARHPVLALGSVVVVAGALLFGIVQDRRAAASARRASHALVSEGRLWTQVGNATEAEARLWNELLYPPAGIVEPARHRELPRVHRRALWGLWELFLQHPCRATRIDERFAAHPQLSLSGDGELLAVTGGKSSEIALLTVPDLERAGSLSGIEEEVQAVRFSPIGSRVVAMMSSGRILVWDLELSSEPWLLGTHPGVPGELRFSNDGETLLTSSRGSDILRWSFADRGEPELFLQVEGRSVHLFALGQDASHVAVATGPTEGFLGPQVLLFDEAGVLRWQSAPREGPSLTDLTFAHGGSHVVCGGRGMWIRSVEGSDGSKSGIRNVHEHIRIAAHPSRPLIANSGEPGDEIAVWELERPAQARILSGHGAQVDALEFSSPNGEWLVSADADGAVKTWSSDAARDRISLGGPEGAHATTPHELTFDREGRWLLTAGEGGVRVWLADTGELSAAFDGGTDFAYSADFDPTSHEWIASGHRDGSVVLTNWVEGGESRRFGSHRSAADSVRFSPDGEVVASTGGNGEVVLWPREGGAPRRLAMDGFRGRFSSLAWSASGEWIVAGQASSPFGLAWVTVAGDAIHASEEHHTGGITSVAASRTGDLFATGSRDTTVKLWRAGSRRAFATLRGHRSPVYAVELDSDGGLLASADAGGWVKLWDVASETELASFPAHPKPIFDLALDPDGRRLASSSVDAHAYVWSFETFDRRIAGNLEAWLTRLEPERGPSPAAEVLRAWAAGLRASD